MVRIWSHHQTQMAFGHSYLPCRTLEIRTQRWLGRGCLWTILLTHPADAEPTLPRKPTALPRLPYRPLTLCPPTHLGTEGVH